SPARRGGGLRRRDRRPRSRRAAVPLGAERHALGPGALSRGRLPGSDGQRRGAPRGRGATAPSAGDGRGQERSRGPSGPRVRAGGYAAAEGPRGRDRAVRGGAPGARCGDAALGRPRMRDGAGCRGGGGEIVPGGPGARLLLAGVPAAFRRRPGEIWGWSRAIERMLSTLSRCRSPEQWLAVTRERA